VKTLEKFEVLEPYSDGIIVEFGAGDSTFYFLSNCKKLLTFETSRKYVRGFDFLMVTNPGKFEIHHFNIGPTKSWGRPILPDFLIRRKVIKSIQAIQAKLRNVDYTTLFIDGRYRVATTLSIVAQSQLKFSVIVDDYYDRPDYKILESYLGPPSALSSDFAKFDLGPSLCADVKKRWKMENILQV
jgi:hypothetical protein